MLIRICSIFLGAVVFFPLGSLNVHASEALWQAYETTDSNYYSLNHNLLQYKLKSSGGIMPRLPNQASGDILSLPLPDGGFTQVALEESAIVDVRLLEKYPQLATWKVTGQDEVTLSGRVDFTEQGFHGILSLKNGKTVYINPVLSEGKNIYHSFYKPVNKSSEKIFSCDVKLPKITDASSSNIPLQHRSIALRTASTIKTYRIAIATTSNFSSNFASKSATLQAIVTVLNRVNEIYERDLSIRLILVDRNDELIFTDMATDPYYEENFQYITNQETIDRIIGSENYDVGHLFTGQAGGLAHFSSLCNSSYKAQAMTGFTGRMNDVFSIDYFAHELGHQFGGTHTFGSSNQGCQQTYNRTAYEPGSGSTIMAYAGLCGSDDLQGQSDAMFHGGSILQIKNFVTSGQGAQCATPVISNNADPVASAGDNYIIPSQTPFILKGTATEVESGDHLTYSWEQFNSGTFASLGQDQGDNAILRTYLPVASPIRVIPTVHSLLSNTVSLGEHLPYFSRSSEEPLRFIFVVRDGRGGVDIDEMTAQVTDDGPFVITSHSTIKTDYIGASTLLNWDVAGTDQAPISCQFVDIFISLNRAESFRLLLKSTPNDGSEALNLPKDLLSSNQVRYKIQCHNNIFFALSKVDTQLSLPYLKVSSPQMIEGNSEQKMLEFEVSLTATLTSAVNFHYKTQNITALSGEDYTAQSGQATIAAGASSVIISVPITTDFHYESDETFAVLVDQITSQTTLRYDSATGTGQLLNDDEEFSLTISDVEMLEGDGHKNLIFELVLATTRPVDIDIPYQLHKGTATDEDFERYNGVVTIKAGEHTTKIMVGISGDTKQEQDESFTVHLSQPNTSERVVLQKTTAIGLIRNDDLNVVPKLTLLNAEVGKDQKSLVLNFEIAFSVIVNVSYNVTLHLNGIETDFKGILMIPDGETRATLTLPLGTQIEVGQELSVLVNKNVFTEILDTKTTAVAFREPLANSPANEMAAQTMGGGSFNNLLLLFFMLYFYRTRFRYVLYVKEG
ncbi:MAG: hypothetical protein KAH22_09640 [Thiotrichaceae bacterium]|nr:hypothetical protein [Thiotrichaceae bacterium]